MSEAKTLDDLELDKTGDLIVATASMALGRPVGIYLAVVDAETGQVQTTTNLPDPAEFIALLNAQANGGPSIGGAFAPTVN
jgi:hypothetical protein